MSKKNTLHFEVSANLQKLIGEELVSNEEMAFIELIKNAYDSGAERVEITLYQETLAAPAYITIVDDGEGTALDDFGERFMFAAYSKRDEEAATADRVKPKLLRETVTKLLAGTSPEWKEIAVKARKARAVTDKETAELKQKLDQHLKS